MHVPLQEGHPCLQHQARRFCHQAPFCRFTRRQMTRNWEALVRGETANAWLGHTTSHIACQDASDAKDEPGLVEEGARWQLPNLNVLHLNVQSATLTARYQACFWRWYRHLEIIHDIILDMCSEILWTHDITSFWYHRCKNMMLFMKSCMISYMILFDIGYDIIINPWYHKFLTSYKKYYDIMYHDIINDFSTDITWYWI